MLTLTAVNPPNHKPWVPLVFLRNYRYVWGHLIIHSQRRYSEILSFFKSQNYTKTLFEIIHMNPMISPAKKNFLDSNPLILYSKLISIADDP